MAQKQNEKAEKPPADSSKVEGEGSYTGTRRYNEHLKRHIDTQNTEELAEKAKQAVQGDEKEALEEAERRGKRGPLIRPEPSQR